jgi:hypothetical protein
MTTHHKMYGYHLGLCAMRWASDLYEFDKTYWRMVGGKRPKKATALLNAHIRRCNGEGSPQACDEVYNEVTKR